MGIRALIHDQNETVRVIFCLVPHQELPQSFNGRPVFILKTVAKAVGQVLSNFKIPWLHVQEKRKA